MKLIRFVVAAVDVDSKRPQGLVQAVHALANSGVLEAWEWDWLEEELEWINDHLDAPVRMYSMGRAIFWF